MSRVEPRKSETEPISADGELLLVVGEARRTARVAARLARLRLEIERASWPVQPARLRRGDVTALVLVLPLAGTGPEVEIRALRARSVGRSIPLFVVSSDALDDAAIRQLYRAGAAAVFTWPKDGEVLADVLAEALGIAQVRGDAASGSVALARTVKAYLRNGGLATPRLRVEVDEGTVYLSGRVDDLRTKLRIRDAVAEVAGVAGVAVDDLRVNPTPRTDRAILADIRAVLRAVSDVAEETITVEVQGGHVVVAGSAADRAELDRVVELLSHVRGVRGIRNYVTVSRRQKADDRILTGHLRQQLAGRFGRERATVSVFGGVAVVTGKASSLAVKRQIGATLSGNPRVDRVVNKMTVT